MIDVNNLTTCNIWISFHYSTWIVSKDFFFMFYPMSKDFFFLFHQSVQVHLLSMANYSSQINKSLTSESRTCVIKIATAAAAFAVVEARAYKVTNKPDKNESNLFMVGIQRKWFKRKDQTIS